MRIKATVQYIRHFAPLRLHKQIFFYLLLNCFYLPIVQAQVLSGHYFGIGRAEEKETAGSYLSELELKQQGKLLTGTFSYYFRDGFFKHTIKGKYSPLEKTIAFKPVNLVYHRSYNVKNAVDCPMLGDFELVIQDKDTFLVGSMHSDEAHKYVSCPIRFRFSKNEMEDKAQDSLPEPYIVAVAPVNSTDTILKKEIPLLHNPALQSIYYQRKQALVQEQELVFSDSLIEVSLYDNGQIDNDSVTIFFNNQQVQQPQRLSHKGFAFPLPLLAYPGLNQLSMLANNLGEVPPNTAVIILKDREHRYELLLVSDLNKTATLRLVYQPAGVHSVADKP